MRFRLLSFMTVALMASSSFGQSIIVGHATNDGLIVRYGPSTGDLSFHSRGDAMTTFELKSESSQFTEVPNDAFGGLFDVYNASKLFKLEPAGFNDLILPGVLPPGLSYDDIASDLTLDGSFARGGALSTVPVILIPEPNSVSLIAIAAFGLLGFRRRLIVG